MAKIRNLKYDGLIVEQPIYDGTYLNRWIHDGIVVWERGGWIQDGTLVTGRTYTNLGNVWHGSLMSLSISNTEPESYLYNSSSPGPNQYPVRYLGLFTFSEYPDVVFGMIGSIYGGEHGHYHRYSYTDRYSDFTSSIQFNIINVHTEEVLCSVKSGLNLRYIEDVYICHNRILYLLGNSSTSGYMPCGYKIQFNAQFTDFEILQTYDNIHFDIPIVSYSQHPTIYYEFTPYMLNTPQLDRYVQIDDTVLDLETGTTSVSRVGSYNTSVLAFIHFVKTSSTYKALGCMTHRIDRPDGNHYYEYYMAVIDIYGNIAELVQGVSYIHYAAYVNNKIYIYYTPRDSTSSLYLLILDSNFSVISRSLVSSTQSFSDWYIQEVTIPSYDGTESKTFRYHDFLPERSKVSMTQYSSGGCRIWSSLNLGAVMNGRSIDADSKLRYVIADGNTPGGGYSRSVSYVYSTDSLGILPSLENIENYRYVSIPEYI